MERVDPKKVPWYLGGLRRTHLARYEFAAQWAQGSKVVDVACGVGYGSVILAEAGATEVVGIDISEDAITYAKAHYAHPRLRYEVRDAADTGLGDQWADAVVSLETIEHLPPERVSRYLQELRRILRDGGTLIISTPNGSISDSLSHYHLQEFSLPELEALLGRHFNRLTVFGQRMMPESYVRLMRRLRKRGDVFGLADRVLRRLLYDRATINAYPQPGKQPLYYVIVAESVA